MDTVITTRPPERSLVAPGPRPAPRRRVTRSTLLGLGGVVTLVVLLEILPFISEIQADFLPPFH